MRPEKIAHREHVVMAVAVVAGGDISGDIGLGLMAGGALRGRKFRWMGCLRDPGIAVNAVEFAVNGLLKELGLDTGELGRLAPAWCWRLRLVAV
jgi:hypothetical protein